MKSVTYVPERLLPIYPVYTGGGNSASQELARMASSRTGTDRIASLMRKIPL